MNKSFAVPILFFISLLVIVYFILPVFSDFSNLKEQLEMRKKEALAIENYYKDIHDNFNKLKEHQENLEKINSAIPADFFMPSLFNYLQKASTENGVFLKGINLSAISKKTEDEEGIIGRIQEEYVSVELVGLYDSFENFLKSIEKSSRLIEVEEVQIAKGEKETLDERLSTLNLLLKVYSY